MKKVISLLLTMMISICCLNAFDVQAAGKTYNQEQVRNLLGTQWREEERILFGDDVAVGMVFVYEKNGSENSDLINSIHAYAASKGYTCWEDNLPMDQIVEGTYACLDTDDSIEVEFIGYDFEAGSLYAHDFTMWEAPEGYNGWEVVYVQDADDGVVMSEDSALGDAAGTIADPVENYVLVLEGCNIPEENKAKSTEAVTACSHEIDHIITKQPTETEDGIVSVKCTKCPHVEYTYTISGNGEFLLNSAKKIQEAADGTTITIHTSRWMSLDRKVLEAIDANPSVTIVVEYWYSDGENGEWRTLTIPAGSKVSAFANEEGFCGFEYLAYRLALEALEK